MRRRRRAYRTFTPSWRITPAPITLERYVADFLIVVLGTGGILLMAGYAALCDRI